MATKLGTENDLELYIRQRIVPMLFRRAAAWRKRKHAESALTYTRAANAVLKALEEWPAKRPRMPQDRRSPPTTKPHS